MPKVSNYISVSVVSQSLILIRYIQKSNCFSFHETQQLRLPVYINREVAFDFAIQCKWITKENEAIAFTSLGNDIIERFNGVTIDRDLWKLILERYIVVCQPAWAKRIPYGRQEAYLFMNEEEQRCFVEAKLIDSYDKDVINWWDSLANAERIKKDVTFDDIGRSGEWLTIQYEENRTRIRPDWIAIESNLAGYDILSQKLSNNNEKILIEVKSSLQSLNCANFYIARHEWDTAKMKNNLHRYFFYLWDLSSTDYKLAIVSANEMRYQIPYDNEFGVWENVRVPFKIFSDRFEIVKGISL